MLITNQNTRKAVKQNANFVQILRYTIAKVRFQIF